MTRWKHRDVTRAELRVQFIGHVGRALAVELNPDRFSNLVIVEHGALRSASGSVFDDFPRRANARRCNRRNPKVTVFIGRNVAGKIARTARDRTKRRNVLLVVEWILVDDVLTAGRAGHNVNTVAALRGRNCTAQRGGWYSGCRTRQCGSGSRAPGQDNRNAKNRNDRSRIASNRAHEPKTSLPRERRP